MPLSPDEERILNEIDAHLTETLEETVGWLRGEHTITEAELDEIYDDGDPSMYITDAEGNLMWPYTPAQRATWQREQVGGKQMGEVKLPEHVDHNHVGVLEWGGAQFVGYGEYSLRDAVITTAVAVAIPTAIALVVCGLVVWLR